MAWFADKQEVVDCATRTIRQQRETIQEQDATIKALVDALGKLCFEVAGLNAFEFEVRHAIGNTNFSCIMARLEKAKTALSSAKETT